MPGAVDVSLAPLGPKDGPDLLLTAPGIGIRLEWQGLRRIRLPQSQPLQDGDGSHLPVEGVQVDPHPVARGEEVLDHVGGLEDAVVPDGVVVPLQGLHHTLDLLGHLQLRQSDNVAQGIEALQV